MMRLLEAGLTAARRQFVVEAVVTLAAVVFSFHDLDLRDPARIGDEIEPFLASISPLLVVAYILTAVGMTFTSGRSVCLTALRIHHASRLLSRTEPERGSKTLVVWFGLSALMLAALALGAPPEPLVMALRYIGVVSATPIVWAATMSIGVALFGASAHAAWRAR